jgi:hypothetical protein
MNKIETKIGTSTNLLNGYNPSWLSADNNNNALYPVSNEPLVLTDIKESGKTGSWENLVVSLHDTPESLMNTLLPYQIQNPSHRITTPKLPSGTLLFGDNDRKVSLQKLSDTLGVNLSSNECGFALVRLDRIDKEVAHTCKQQGVLVHPNPSRIPSEFGVKTEFTEGMAALKRIKNSGNDLPEKITIQDANDYLNFYSKKGTHFVSSVTLGDVIFQVFAIPHARFEIVKKIYSSQPEMLSGFNAQLFSQYTTGYKDNNSGYVQEYGTIIAFSQSEVLKKAIENKEWNETFWAKQESIFALYQNDSSISTRKLNQEYTEVTSIMTNLTTLTLFAEHSRKQIWERIFKGGIIQKFENAIQPKFVSYCGSSLDMSLRSDTISGFLSDIGTPTVNSYAQSVDISEIDIIAPEVVKDFTLYMNYGYSSSQKPISVPGKDILICGQLFSLETQNYITTLEISDEAMTSLTFSAQQFYGGLLIRNHSQTTHFTIVDGLKYVSTTGEFGRGSVEVSDDVRSVPPVSMIDKLKNNLQFNYAFAETNLNSLTPESDLSTKDFLRKSILWITEIIPEDCDDIELVKLRMSALNAYCIEQDSNLGAYVPILKSENYQEQIDSILNYTDEINNTITNYQQQISERKTQELVVKVGKDLNDNIIHSGKLLSDYIDASMEQQKALSGYYDTIINQKKSEQKQQENQCSDLESQLHAQQAEVNTAVLNYQQAIKDQVIANTILGSINLCLNVATNLFDLTNNIVTPANAINPAKHMGLKGQKIQKFRNIVNSSNKFLGGIVDDIENLVELQQNYDLSIEAMSTNLAWDTMSVDMDEILDKGPSGQIVDSARKSLQNSFTNLVLIGKALTVAEASVQNIAGEIYSKRRQQELIEDQAKRLEDLNTNLSPTTIDELDVSNIDLIGLTGSLSFIQSSMQGMLASTFIIKDQALRYEYLQTPTAIESFDSLGIKQALVKQGGKRLDAQTLMGQYQTSKTAPIDVEITIPIESIRDGRIHEFNIGNVPELRPYVHLRVQSVLAKIDGIKSTTEGNYLLNIAYLGRPFMDRSIDRSTAVFNTIRREHNYIYKIEGNEPQFTDQGEGWSENVSPITPYSTWSLSLPKKITNSEIEFEGLTATLTMTFVIEARINDEDQLSTVAKKNDIPAKPPLQQLLDKMAGRTVLNGWDVVFNMGVNQINKTLEIQYDELKAKDEIYGGRIMAKSVIQITPLGGLDAFELEEFDINYGYPKLEFLHNNKGADCSLLMQINSGTVKQGSRFEGEDNEKDRSILEALAILNDLPIDSVKEETIDSHKILVLEYYTSEGPLKGTPTLSSIVQLSQVQGLVHDQSNIMSVTLDMAEGAFSIDDIEMSYTQSVAFSFAVKAYFAKHEVMFIINSLDLSDITTLPDLQPHQFKIVTNSEYDILQLFILTNDRNITENLNNHLHLLDGIGNPIPDESECSLMISSEILFKSVLPESFIDNPNAKEIHWELKGEDPNEINKAWSAEFYNAPFLGFVDLSSLNRSGGGSAVTVHFSYTPEGGNPVTFDLDGMKINPNAKGTLKMLLPNKIETFNFIETRNYSQKMPFSSPNTWTETSNSKTDVSLDLFTDLPTSIEGKGIDQQINIKLKNDDIHIIARTSGGGACGSDDLQAKINKELKEQLPEQIREHVNVSFKGVSVFALENLLFSSGSYITLKESLVPGDLLILGSFSKDE